MKKKTNARVVKKSKVNGKICEDKVKVQKISFGAVIENPGSTTNYKTGSWRVFKPSIDSKKCIKCGKCWLNCPDAAIKKTKDGLFVVDYDYCKGCLICYKECPVKAISYVTEDK